MNNNYYKAKTMAYYIRRYKNAPERVFSVSRHVTHKGEEWHYIYPVIGEGYVGYLPETRYMDGSEDGTFWRVKVGTLEECVDYVLAH